MPKVSVERTIGTTKKAVLNGLLGYNAEKMEKQKYKRLAISLRERNKIVGGVVGEVLWARSGQRCCSSSCSGWNRNFAGRTSVRS